jgi:hypothetical protein
MANIDKTKEILGFFKILFALILATTIALISWAAQNYNTMNKERIIMSISAFIFLQVCFLILYRKIKFEYISKIKVTEPPPTKPIEKRDRVKKSKSYNPNLIKLMKRCNRDTPKSEFWEFFKENYKKQQGKPQIYFIYGNDDEKHKSFIDRLYDKEIKNYFEIKKKTDIDIKSPKLVKWPEISNFKTFTAFLKQNLFSKFEHPDPADDSATAFISLSKFNNCNSAIIYHNIYLSNWKDKVHPEVIKWYLKDYWSKIKPDANNVQLLIFFNMIYPENHKIGWKKWFRSKIDIKTQIREQIQKIIEEVNDICPCKQLKELESVKKRDIKDWVETYLPELEDTIFSMFEKIEECSMKIFEKRLKEEILSDYKEMQIKKLEKQGIL